MMPEISVIIPTYNCEKYLPDAIESALQQKQQCIEIIVINDGSTDNTDEVAQPYLDRITYIKQENRGLSAARNVGIRASQGRFVCFLDADDILLPNKFERQLEKFEHETSLGVVISGFIFVEEDGQTEVQYIKKFWYHDALQRLLNHEVFPPHAALIRRSALESSNLFSENIDTYESQEDWQLWLELALNGVQFDSYPEPTCKYRIRSNSIRSNPLKHLDGARRVVNWLKIYPKAIPYKNQIDRLEAIIEMERVAAAYTIGANNLIGEILIPALKNWPVFWQDPHTFRRMFERILTPHQSSIWYQNPDPKWFEKVIIKNILEIVRNNINKSEFKRIHSAANLALCDIAYGVKLHVRQTLIKALIESPKICFSNNGIYSTIRGILGPRIGGFASDLIAKFKFNKLYIII